MNGTFVTFSNKQAKKLPPQLHVKGDPDQSPEKVTTTVSPTPKGFSDNILHIDEHVQKEGLCR